MRAARECNGLLGKESVEGRENREMVASSRLIFLTVPYDTAVEAVKGIGPLLNHTHIVIDVTVPMTFHRGHAEYVEQDGRSNSEIIASNMPAGIPLVAAFKTIPAAVLADLEVPLDCSVLVCGDEEEACRAVIETASVIPSLRPVAAGPLRMARTLERMTVLAAELNRRYHRKGARYRVEGI